MTIVLALAVLTVSASAIEDAQTVKPSRVSIMCTKSGEHLGGLTKVCYYSCAGSEGALKEPAYEACPGWTPRWRLNHNSQFGPNKKSR